MMGIFSGLLSGLGLSGLTDTAGVLVAFFATITDYRMWRSLGWLLLGILMIAGGLAMWAKDSVIGGIAGRVTGGA
jgi:uncharacterized membrane protein